MPIDYTNNNYQANQTTVNFDPLIQAPLDKRYRVTALSALTSELPSYKRYVGQLVWSILENDLYVFKTGITNGDLVLFSAQQKFSGYSTTVDLSQSVYITVTHNLNSLTVFVTAISATGDAITNIDWRRGNGVGNTANSIQVRANAATYLNAVVIVTSVSTPVSVTDDSYLSNISYTLNTVATGGTGSPTDIGSGLTRYVIVNGNIDFRKVGYRITLTDGSSVIPAAVRVFDGSITIDLAYAVDNMAMYVYYRDRLLASQSNQRAFSYTLNTVGTGGGDVVGVLGITGSPEYTITDGTKDFRYCNALLSKSDGLVIEPIVTWVNNGSFKIRLDTAYDGMLLNIFI